MTRLESTVTERVRRRLAASGAEVTPAAVAAAVREELAGLVGDTALLELVNQAQSEFVGAGPLEPLLRHPATTDVLVNAPDQVWVDQGAGLRRGDIRFADDEAVRRLAVRLAAAAGRRLDDAQPWVDAVLPDGTRMHAILPPISVTATCLSLRVLRTSSFSLEELVRVGTLDRAAAALLRRMIETRLAFLVTGGTGSGKTTLLRALLSQVRPQERLVVVEDATELRPDHPHAVALVARPPNVENAGAVTMRDLVRQALRMRPDRLVVGEVRGAEVVDLLAALNTGHDGGCGTVHANGVDELPARLEALAAVGGMGREALHSQLAAAVQMVVHVGRDRRGRRVLLELGMLHRDDGLVRVRSAWRRDGGPTPGADRLAELLASRQ